MLPQGNYRGKSALQFVTLLHDDTAAQLTTDTMPVDCPVKCKRAENRHDGTRQQEVERVLSRGLARRCPLDMLTFASPKGGLGAQAEDC